MASLVPSARTLRPFSSSSSFLNTCADGRGARAVSPPQSAGPVAVRSGPDAPRRGPPSPWSQGRHNTDIADSGGVRFPRGLSPGGRAPPPPYRRWRSRRSFPVAFETARPPGPVRGTASRHPAETSPGWEPRGLSPDPPDCFATEIRRGNKGRRSLSAVPLRIGHSPSVPNLGGAAEARSRRGRMRVPEPAALPDSRPCQWEGGLSPARQPTRPKAREETNGELQFSTGRPCTARLEPEACRPMQPSDISGVSGDPPLRCNLRCAHATYLPTRAV